MHSVSAVRSLLGVLLKPQYREYVQPFLMLQALASILRVHLEHLDDVTNGSQTRSSFLQEQFQTSCVSLSGKILSPVWNLLYAEAIGDSRASLRAQTLLHEVRLKLRERVRSSDVFEGTSKQIADRKLAGVQFVLPQKGGPRPRDLPALGDSFLGNTLTALGFLQRARLSSDRLRLLTRQESPKLRRGRGSLLIVPASQLRSPYASRIPFLDLSTLGALAAQRMLQASALFVVFNKTA